MKAIPLAFCDTKGRVSTKPNETPITLIIAYRKVIKTRPFQSMRPVKGVSKTITLIEAPAANISNEPKDEIR